MRMKGQITFLAVIGLVLTLAVFSGLAPAMFEIIASGVATAIQYDSESTAVLLQFVMPMVVIGILATFIMQMRANREEQI